MVDSEIQLVWFKRDLRIVDHRPLAEAARHGPVLPVYVVEPGYWQQADTSARHRAFVAESLASLDAALSRLGQGLLVERGDVTAVFARLHRRFGIAAVHAHEETGTDWTFARDRRVRAWCRQQGIACHEYPQFGVPGAAIFEPWKLSALDRARYGAAAYPEPIVDHLAAVRHARDCIAEVRKRPGFRAQAGRVQHELGSRRAGLPRTRRAKKKKTASPSPQRSLF